MGVQLLKEAGTAIGLNVAKPAMRRLMMIEAEDALKTYDTTQYPIKRYEDKIPMKMFIIFPN